MPINHKFRIDKNNFLPDNIEQRLAHENMLISVIESSGISAGHKLVGKHHKILGSRHQYKCDPNDPTKMKPWLRRSILFDLPYWKEHSI